MPLTPRSTAAASSRVNKRPAVSPIKKHRSQLKKILPSQAKYVQNIKKKSLSDSPSIASNKSDCLTITNYNVHFDFQLSPKHDIMVAIDTILENQWAESTTLHQRFHSNVDASATDLLFLLRGLSMESKASILKYRQAHLSEGLVTLNQLYSIYVHTGNTFVDRSLEMKIRDGQLRKFVITNASPIILRSPQKFQKGKITYGFENAEVVVKSQTYFDLINSDIQKIETLVTEPTDDMATKKLQLQSLRKFSKFVSENRSTHFVSPNENISAQELSSLVSLGYVTLTSNHLNELEEFRYALSYPNCGTFLKLINTARSWIVKTLSKNPHKEMLEETLFNKWEGSSQDNPKMTNFKKPFYGYELYWILADALGAGVVEVFNTPVGRGWKLTGKL